MTALKDELTSLANDFFSGEYEIVDGRVVPVVEDLKFGKVGKEIELAMLFVDIRHSTKIVENIRRTTAARMYQTFLSGVSRIVRSKGGNIRSFNGDGLLAVFDGDSKNTNSTEAALKIVWFCREVLSKKMQAYFANNQGLKDFKFSFGIGIDVGTVLVVKGGIKGSNNNDLVWAGNATNKAVKLSDFASGNYNVWISDVVYKRLQDSSKYTTSAGVKTNLWEIREITATKETIYRSHYQWTP